MGILKTITSIIAQKAYLVSKTQIAAHTFHLEFELEKPLKNYVPGKQIKIFVGMDSKSGLSDFGRTYSVWKYDEELLTFDIAACTFSDGPGANWVREVAFDDLIYFSGPDGKFTLENNAENHLFLGDISALGHFYEIARNVQSSNYKGFIYGNDISDFFSDHFSDVRFEFISHPGNAFEDVKEKVKELRLKPESSTVYIAGETRFCIEMNRYFKNELGWPGKYIKNKPFWHPDKKGLE